jgi:mRNA interferase RelE/StbE
VFRQQPRGLHLSAKNIVMIAPRAQKQIAKLPREVLPRVIHCLEELENDPHPTGVEKLNQNPNFWRMKAGEYRVVYTICENRTAIVVALVSPRREVYREVANLNYRHLVDVVANDMNYAAASGVRH